MRSKLEQRARRSPGSLTFDDVRRLAEGNGFAWRVGWRGHAVVSHPLLPHTVGVAEPHPDKHVKPTYVRGLLDALDAVRAAPTTGRADEGDDP